MVEHKLEIESFYQSASESYLTSRVLIASIYLAPIGLYHAHLTLECMLKGMLAEHNIPLEKTHDLTELVEKLEKVHGDSELFDQQLLNTIEWLNPYQELGRYGAMSRAMYDPQRRENKNFQVKGVRVTNPLEDIRKIDSAVKRIDDSSEYSGIERRCTSDRGRAQWNLPFTLDDAFYSDNESFQPH